MIRKPGDTPGTHAGGISETGKHASRKWLWGCVLLVVITWIPVLGVHLYRTSLADSDTGTVVVVFPPTAVSRELFRSVAEARGSLVRPVPWFPRMWVAMSLEPGFVGRLKERGAWAVYSTEVLSARALLTCLRPGGSRAASAAPEPLAPAS